MFDIKGYNISIPYGDSAAIKFKLTDRESGEPYQIPPQSRLRFGVYFPKSSTDIFVKTAGREDQGADGSVTFLLTSDETKLARHSYRYTLALVRPGEDKCDTLIGFPENALFCVDEVCPLSAGEPSQSGITVSVDTAGDRLPYYEGSCTIEPSFDTDITVATAGKSLESNITVRRAELPGNVFSFSAIGKFQYPENVVVPNTVTAIQGSEQSFRSHTEIKTLTFESGSTISAFPSDAFNGCTGLESISLPATIRSMGNAVFSGCSSLKAIVIPNGITNIGNWTCYNCTSLRSVTLPSSITSMNNSNSFGNCSAVEEIILGTNWNYAANFSFTTLLSAQVLVNMLASLKDLTGTTSKTLTLGADNLAKLTEDQKAVATSKNWVLA